MRAGEIPPTCGEAARHYERLVASVIEKIRQTPGRQGGETSPLADVWLEYASQVQGVRSVMWGPYVEIVEDYCRQVLIEMTALRVAHLFYHSAAAERWEDEGDPENEERGVLPQPDEMRSAVAEELRRRVDQVAINLELPGSE